MTRRSMLVIIALLCLSALGVALVSQHVYGMAPCAWCVLQRLIYVLIAAFCLLGAAGRDSSQRGTAVLVTLLAVCGIAAAWYQHSVAAHMLSCDQTFADRFMVSSGLDSTMPALFGIFAMCIDAIVSVLGVEYAIWSLLLYAVIAALAITAILKRPSADQASFAA